MHKVAIKSEKKVKVSARGIKGDLFVYVQDEPVGEEGLAKDCVRCHFAGPSALTWNRALPLPKSYQFPEEIPAAGKHDLSTPGTSTLPHCQQPVSPSWSLSRP